MTFLAGTTLDDVDFLFRAQITVISTNLQKVHKLPVMKLSVLSIFQKALLMKFLKILLMKIVLLTQHKKQMITTI